MNNGLRVIIIIRDNKLLSISTTVFSENSRLKKKEFLKHAYVTYQFRAFAMVITNLSRLALYYNN